MPHRGQQQHWQVVEGSLRFDLQHDSKSRRIEIADLAQQGINVLGMLHERERHHVRVFGDKSQVLNVLRSKRRQLEVRFWYVDALLRSKLSGTAGDVGDLDP